MQLLLLFCTFKFTAMHVMGELVAIEVCSRMGKQTNAHGLLAPIDLA
jgi:hypothetical protein